MLCGPSANAVVNDRGIEGSAKDLVNKGPAKLARMAVRSSYKLIDRSTDLWLIVQGFHLLSSPVRCAIISGLVRGFAALKPADQAKFASFYIPRMRVMRLGWQEVRGNDTIPGLVGRIGRKEADPHLVVFVDTVEASLRRLGPRDRREAWNTLDVALSESLSPVVLAKLFVEMKPADAEALEAWIVEEEALAPDAARRFFNALKNASSSEQRLSQLASAGVDSLRSAWETLAVDGLDVEGFLPMSWLSKSEEQVADDDARGLEPTAELHGRRFTEPSRRSSKCKLHCPGSAFLMVGVPKASGESSQTTTSGGYPASSRANLGPAPNRSKGERDADSQLPLPGKPILLGPSSSKADTKAASAAEANPQESQCRCSEEGLALGKKFGL